MPIVSATRPFRFVLAAGLAALLLAPAARAADAAPDYLTLQQLRARYGQAASRYTIVRGAEIHYIDEGRGPVVVLIHGSNSSLKTYDRVAARLKGQFRVIRFDQPGMGLSGPAPQALLDLPLYPVAVTEDLTERLGVRSATFVGVSSGGTIAFYLAARRPALVERLVLSNTPADPVESGGMRQSRAMAAQAPTKSNSYGSMAFWRAFFDFFTGEPERADDAKIAEYYDMNRRVPSPSKMAIVAAMADRQTTQAQLASITVPTLLVWGARDPLLTPPTADILAGYMTAAPVSKVLMPDVGHYPPLEAPERFADIVRTYIQSVTPLAPRAPPPADR